MKEIKQFIRNISKKKYGAAKENLGTAITKTAEKRRKRIDNELDDYKS